MTLNFEIRNQYAKIKNNCFLATDTVNYPQCKFNFSADWENFVKTALFSNNSGTYAVLLENDACTVPKEVLTGDFDVSLYGINTDSAYTRITTNAVSIHMEKSGFTEGKTPEEPTPDVYETIISCLAEQKQMLKTADESIASCRGNITDIYAKISDISEKHTEDIVNLQTNMPEKFADYVRDADYVHTDNNYTDSDKQTVDYAEENRFTVETVEATGQVNVDLNHMKEVRLKSYSSDEYVYLSVNGRRTDYIAWATIYASDFAPKLMFVTDVGVSFSGVDCDENGKFVPVAGVNYSIQFRNLGDVANPVYVANVNRW